MVSPRKSRKKSACFSRTRTSTPARASRKPSTMPAGPPPAMQQVVGVVCEVEFSAMAEPRQEFATDLNVPGRNERWLLRDNLADAVMAETAQYETPEPMVSIA